MQIRPLLLLRALSPYNSFARSVSGKRELPSVPRLREASVEKFRHEAFDPQKPSLLPQKHFAKLPACEKWFRQSTSNSSTTLDHDYLTQHAGSTLVPLEYTKVAEDGSDEFQRLQAPLSVFLAWSQLATPASSERMYLAQCQVTDLPLALRDDLPTPELVARTGKGDVYDTNTWIGLAPTNTPLHRDPNPNLFVQLAGTKVVRVFPPHVGSAIFAQVQHELGKDGSASVRDETMMYGKEKSLLDHHVWGGSVSPQHSSDGCEAYLEAGDGLFIPKGWWHSIRGIGEGVTASVNWWFR